MTFQTLAQYVQVMPTRKHLKDVVRTLCHAFTSRNNDLEGYWGIGKLCLLAQERGVTVVQLDLFARDIVPEGVDASIADGFTDYYYRFDGEEPAPFVAVLTPSDGRYNRPLQRYARLLENQLQRQGLAMGYVRTASLRVDYAPVLLSTPRSDGVLSGHCQIALTIVDDRGKVYVHETTAFCWPHNPKWEMQRGPGVEAFLERVHFNGLASASYPPAHYLPVPPQVTSLHTPSCAPVVRHKSSAQLTQMMGFMRACVASLKGRSYLELLSMPRETALELPLSLEQCTGRITTQHSTDVVSIKVTLSAPPGAQPRVGLTDGFSMSANGQVEDSRSSVYYEG